MSVSRGPHAGAVTGAPTPRARARNIAFPIDRGWTRGTRTTRRLPRAATAPRPAPCSASSFPWSVRAHPRTWSGRTPLGRVYSSDGRRDSSRLERLRQRPGARRGDGGVRNRSGQDPPRRPSDSPKRRIRDARTAAAPAARTVRSSPIALADETRRSRDDHAHLLERDESGRDVPNRLAASPMSAERITACLMAPRAWRPRSSGTRCCERSGVFRRLGDTFGDLADRKALARHGTRRRTARGRRAESSLPAARARRRRPRHCLASTCLAHERLVLRRSDRRR